MDLDLTSLTYEEVERSMVAVDHLSRDPELCCTT